MDEYFAHHGIKGQKWGVRRYTYADGTLTPAGRKRYNNDSSRFNKLMSTNVKYLINSARAQVTGKQYVDGFIKMAPRWREFRPVVTSKSTPFMLPIKSMILMNTWGCLAKIL